MDEAAKEFARLELTVLGLATEFRGFRNTVIGLYVTTIAPLLVIVVATKIGG